MVLFIDLMWKQIKPNVKYFMLIFKIYIEIYSWYMYVRCD